MTKINLKSAIIGFVYYFVITSFLELILPDAKNYIKYIIAFASLVVLLLIYYSNLRKTARNSKDINENDERHKYLISKTSTITLYITVLGLVFAIIFLIIIDLDNYANALRILFLSIILVYSLVYYYLRRRY